MRLKCVNSEVDAEYRRISSLGVEVKEAPKDLPWGYRYFNIKDPDGNGVEGRADAPSGSVEA